MTGDDEELGDKVADILAGLDLFDERTRDALVKGVREALRDPNRPEVVTVVHGGQEPAVPRLRVVTERERAPPDADTRVSLQVRSASRRALVSLDEGHVRLAGGEDVWQTLRHGRTPVAYRIHCDLGELHVAADGELVVRLEEGQTTDVEGAVIRVRGVGGPGEGRFVLVEST